MIRPGSGSCLFTLLGLGTADLALLNLWALPALLVGPELEHSASPAVEAAPARAQPASSASAAPPIAIRPDPEAKVALRANASATGALGSGQPARVAASEPQQEQEPAPPEAAAPIVHFARGSWWLGPRTRDALLEVLSELADRGDPSAVIEVQGHADHTGSRVINQRISEERARAVADALMRYGIDPSRIRVRGFGEDRPSATGRDRRVEIALRGER